MEYQLKVNEEIICYLVDSAEDGHFQVSCGGPARDVGYRVITPHHLHLTVDGHGVNAYVAGNGSGQMVIIKGIPYYLEEMGQQTTFRKRESTVPTVITPPMPAVVVEVLVRQGDLVKKGDRVIVLTAMKMETTLIAPYDGRVTEVRVVAGDKVMPGQILMDIEKGQELSVTDSED